MSHGGKFLIQEESAVLLVGEKQALDDNLELVCCLIVLRGEVLDIRADELEEPTVDVGLSMAHRVQWDWPEQSHR